MTKLRAPGTILAERTRDEAFVEAEAAARNESMFDDHGRPVPDNAPTARTEPRPFRLRRRCGPIAALALVVLSACSSMQSDPGWSEDTEGGTESVECLDVGLVLGESHAGEPWGPCLPGLECDEGAGCFAGEQGPDTVSMCLPLAEPECGALGCTHASDGVWCLLRCDDSSDCAPEMGVVCSEEHVCGWLPAET